MVQKKRGFIHDSISDMLTRIRNACLAKKTTVSVPFTRINQQIAQILEKEGFIQTFYTSSLMPQENLLRPNESSVGMTPALQDPLYNTDIIIRLKYRSKTIYKGKKKESCITNLKRISKPGLRIYANNREIPRILGGTGVVIISTPEGIMTDREARLKGIGGELLCSVW
uniref:Small ribosomal subunit protein uS8c n=1 Tax=Oogamochlamys gigantea TaxID=158507 RepID=A0A0S2LMY2_9CHLO|nr:ribosomal protein S8 [Oogamochlamys gigantea]ALO62821.1 ribosomal protein S8 [Oogamochlamys gigantea]